MEEVERNKKRENRRVRKIILREEQREGEGKEVEEEARRKVKVTDERKKTVG